MQRAVKAMFGISDGISHSAAHSCESGTRLPSHIGQSGVINEGMSSKDKSQVRSLLSYMESSQIQSQEEEGIFQGDVTVPSRLSCDRNSICS